MEVETFLQDYWGQRPLYLKATDPKRFAHLFSRRRFEELINANGHPVHATFNDFGNERARQAQINNEIKLTPQQTACIRAMTDATVTLGDLQDAEPAIGETVASFKRELRHGGAVRCAAWLSKPSTGLPAHFDESSSFMLQIEGRKKWRCSPAVAVEYPSIQGLLGPDSEALYFHFRRGGINEKVDPWMKQVVHTDESKFIEFTMEPGDACFIPAGVWHTTVVDDSKDGSDSLGLNLRMAHTTMWDLFSMVLKKELQRDPAWRHLPVCGLNRKQVLMERLDDLREKLASIKPESLQLEHQWLEIISESNSRPVKPSELKPDTRLRLSRSRPLISYGSEAGGGPIIIFAGEGSMRFYEKRFLPFASRLLRGDEFEAGVCGDWFAEPCHWDELKGILQTLMENGIIERA
jgi:ribosomal protein L16 Arg81 hydroxylase